MTNAELLLRTVEKTADALKLGRELMDWGFQNGERIGPMEIRQLRKVRELLRRHFDFLIPVQERGGFQNE